MVTTVQIHEKVKSELDALKSRPRETYEEVIKRLIREADTQRRMNHRLLAEGYKEMAVESLKLCGEFEFADREVEE